MEATQNPPAEQAAGATPAEGNGASSKMLSKNDIRQVQEILAIERCEVPEWGGHIYLRELSGKERDAYESSMLKGQGRKQRLVTDNVRAKLVALAACDENRQPLFVPADADWLGTRGAAPLHRAYQVAARLSGITDDDVEELAKNSGRGLFGDGQ